ncbi:MAG: hypothetical protein M1829_006561 [Trizodia sp. TS-e1964]|nr:MAG: hypothetical protein M1829_006561 [Trizodia sp. TS-e1964]
MPSFHLALSAYLALVVLFSLATSLPVKGKKWDFNYHEKAIVQRDLTGTQARGPPEIPQNIDKVPTSGEGRIDLATQQPGKHLPLGNVPVQLNREPENKIVIEHVLYSIQLPNNHPQVNSKGGGSPDSTVPALLVNCEVVLPDRSVEMVRCPEINPNADSQRQLFTVFVSLSEEAPPMQLIHELNLERDKLSRPIIPASWKRVGGLPNPEKAYEDLTKTPIKKATSNQSSNPAEEEEFDWRSTAEFLLATAELLISLV